MLMDTTVLDRNYLDGFLFGDKDDKTREGIIELVKTDNDVNRLLRELITGYEKNEFDARRSNYAINQDAVDATMQVFNYLDSSDNPMI